MNDLIVFSGSFLFSSVIFEELKLCSEQLYYIKRSFGGFGYFLPVLTTKPTEYNKKNKNTVIVFFLTSFPEN